MQTVWYLVADLNNPTAEPFAVLRADIAERADSGGCEATVVSLHWTKPEAELEVLRLSEAAGLKPGIGGMDAIH